MDGDTQQASSAPKFVVEVIYQRDLYGTQDQRFERESPEEAAQIYESEAETRTPPLPQILEELAGEGLRLRSLCTETGKLVIAYELETAGVV